jgi:cytoskeletal protein CcmA (bactofilin family)
MFGKSKRPAHRIDTLVSRTVQLQGDLVFSGGMHLEGHIRGNVSSTDGMLSVSEHGVIEGTVDVPRVELQGQVTGNIHAREQLSLGPRAQVHGDVAYGALQMSVGATVNGRLLKVAGDSEPKLLSSSEPR